MKHRTRFALICCNLFSLLTNLLYTVVIPGSLDLAERLNKGPIFSGLIISSYQGAKVMGYVPIWLLNRWQPSASIDHARKLFVISAVLIAFGTCLAVHVSLWPRHTMAASTVVLVGRGIAGVGVAIGSFTAKIFVARVSSKDEQPMNSARYAFYGMLGVGLGPLVSSVATELVVLLNLPRGKQLGVVGFEVLPCVTVMVLAVAFPRSSEVVTYAEQVVEEAGSAHVIDGGSLAWKKRLIASCIFVGGIRAMVVSGLEAATVMILEQRGLGGRLSGCIIGGAFMTCILQKVAFEQCRHLVPTVSWVRIALASSTLSTLLLFESISGLLFSDALGQNCVLVLSDMILFPSFMLASGLIEGTATSNALPRGSAFDLNNLMLWNMVCIDVVGRFVGPPLARAQIDAQGQDGYALQQLMMTCTAFIVTELGVFRPQHATRKAKDLESVTLVSEMSGNSDSE